PAGSGTVDVRVQSGLTTSVDTSENITKSIFGYGVSAITAADRFTYGGASLVATTISLSVPSPPAVFGQPVTINAIVSGTNSRRTTPTGTVMFYRGSSGGTLLGTAMLDANGMASLTPSNLPVGLRNLYASYSGDANFQMSNSPTPTPTSLTVNPANTTT